LDFVVSGHNQDFTLLNIVGWGQLPTNNAWVVRVLRLKRSMRNSHQFSPMKSPLMTLTNYLSLIQIYLGL
jgi:hypothetical protein